MLLPARRPPPHTINTSIYDSLQERSRAGKIVFRIWHDDATSSGSATPRPSPSIASRPVHARAARLPSNEGFVSEHPYFHHLTTDEYRKLDVDLLPIKQNVWVQESIVQHVKGDLEWVRRNVNRNVQIDIPEPPHSRRYSSRQLALQPHRHAIARENGRSATPATTASLMDIDDLDELCTIDDDAVSMATVPSDATLRTEVVPSSMVAEADEDDTPSPWIVTHGNLDWTIHRITRLLGRGKTRTVRMTIIRTEEIGIEHFTPSAAHLSILKANQAWGTAERQTLTEAVRFANTSGEVFFYGRIFPESCEETYEWTAEVSCSMPHG